MACWRKMLKFASIIFFKPKIFIMYAQKLSFDFFMYVFVVRDLCQQKISIEKKKELF